MFSRSILNELWETIVPVGLFGFAKNIAFVLSPHKGIKLLRLQVASVSFEIMHCRLLRFEL